MKKQTVTVTVNNEELARTLKIKPGSKVQVETKGYVPISREWRNRFKDSKIDGCITINQNSKTTKSKVGENE